MRYHHLRRAADILGSARCKFFGLNKGNPARKSDVSMGKHRGKTLSVHSARNSSRLRT